MKRGLVLVVAGVLLLGCGGGTETDEGEASSDSAAATTSETTRSTVAPDGEVSTGVDGGEITDARVVAEFYANTVVEWGEAAFDLEALAEGTAEVYPDLSLSGSAVAADPTTVSAIATLVDDKSSQGPDNPGVIAFAVRDTGDRCIGVAVVGDPAPTEILRFEGEDGDQCTAYEMSDAAAEQFATG